MSDDVVADVTRGQLAGGVDHHESTLRSRSRGPFDGGPDMIQLLDPEGQRVLHGGAQEYAHHIDALTDEDLRGFYRDLVLIRRFDSRRRPCSGRVNSACGSRSSGRRPHRSAAGGRCGPRTMPSRAIASTASPGAAAWTRCG
jgi:hypothetical protein